MFDFFKKKETPQPKKASSLFASDSIPRFKRDFAEELHRITFQKTITDFKAVDSKGNQIALDGQTIGNPNGLKPFIEPVTNVPYAQMLWYASQSFIGYQLCALLSQNWLINKACIMPARDATRHGYELVTHDGQEIEEDVLAFIKHVDKHRYKINTNLINLVRFNRVFGIRIALFDIETEDETFYENPFNIDGVRPYSYKGISQVDPYWITPELDMNSASNPASIDFYEPTWWRVNGKRYHKSHLIVLRNSLVPDVLKPTYLYGGLSIPQMIAERVFASEKTANEAPQLAMTKRTNVFKTDIEAAISDQASFEQKLQWYAQMRDNYGMKVIGQDDAIEQHDI